MIQLPKRSVTRFFIPLIDVLTLLFCIFLLMPMIKATADGSFPQSPPALEPITPDVAADRAAWKRLDVLQALQERRELEQIRREKIESLQERLSIKVLEIDAGSGELAYYDGQERSAILTQEDALRLIARHKQDAGRRELYYLILYPRRLTGYPEQRQMRQYERWFQDVAHGTDNPSESAKR
jgi:hypothetical protein